MLMVRPHRSTEWDEKDAVRASTEVNLDAATAFDRFRRDLFRWWPRSFTWSGAALEDLIIEGRKGGFCWERGPFGFRSDWGRVLRWVPPDRFIISWQVGPGRVPQPDPARASEVEFRFIPIEPHRTKLQLEHRNFAAHGEGHTAYREMMAGEGGWPLILNAFSAYCEGKSPRRDKGV